ncbi:hypothetical protein Q5H92_14095 [Hymenobacter sp. M29]|uniref:Glycosyltransferase RgtA/B/C/D-like domain-containing protein n=1 Tax=Hymenobacter mellowenesis TaxID=3063995 RepID=A0ABT9ACB7_9BACT|nr:hypothetical protein [Hymenobacter sp. M29]MDO7847498.1 hypothetical protein [Hymenobacter sp. M29]
MTPVRLPFWLLLGLALLAGCAGHAALVLGTVSWAEARSLDAIFPFYGWRTRPFSEADFSHLRQGLALAAGLCAVGTAAVVATNPARQELSRLRAETGASWRRLRQGLQMTISERRWAIGLFAALTLLRLYFSLTNPEYDDAVSYEVFVNKGLFATSAYYPIPNNHVFSNTISWLFYQVSPNFWWCMRLPVLLISTAATVGWFAALKPRLGFRAATVATAAFAWLQLSLYHAGVGRGYWLIIGLAGLVFFSTLRLVEATTRPRAAWLALAVAGIVGCYTVPTFAYVLASAFSWLAVCFIRTGRWSQLVCAGLVGSIVGMGAALLYTPLLLVSGFDKFVGNGYVASLATGVFWRGFPAYIWHNEGFLAGQRTLGALVTLPVLGLVGLMFYQVRRDQLPAEPASRLRRVGVPALWFMALPYAVISFQHVFPPERVMLYKACFFFILLGIAVDWLLLRWPASRPLRRVLAVLAIGFVGYETYSVIRVNPAARRTNGTYYAALRWLTTQPASTVLIPEPTHNLFFRFYAHSQERQRPWHFDNIQQANTRYRYVVAFPNDRGFFKPRFPFAPAYHNDEVDIYVVPPDFPLQANAWRHD